MVLVLVAWAASQVVVLVIVQCLITSEATADQLAMVATLQIRVPSIPHGVNLLRQVLRIQLAQVVQVQQARRLILDVLPHQTLLVKQVTQRLQM